jgi:sugar phosphate isomerase/epimerase
VTLFLLDIASYQGDLKLTDVQAAGFTIVNFKVSHGVTLPSSIHPDLDELVAQARDMGLGISTFHWLDNSAPGIAQAAHCLDRLERLDLHLPGTMHVVDCESTSAPATYEIWQDYCSVMQPNLVRPIATYTGDWWWTPRGWDGAALTPHLHAAPNAGYPGGYPGDKSEQWKAGYGGWDRLAIMQYAVKPLPGGTIDVSMSAIRDPLASHRLIGGEDSC